MTDHEKLVMRNIIYAVETGGQVYGQKDYADFTEAYTNSSAEHAITIGAGSGMAMRLVHFFLRLKLLMPQLSASMIRPVSRRILIKQTGQTISSQKPRQKRRQLYILSIQQLVIAARISLWMDRWKLM